MIFRLERRLLMEKKKYSSLRILTIMFVLFLCSSMVVSAKSQEQLTVVNEYALSFMRESAKNDGIVLHETKTMYDFEKNVTGYYVTFSEKEKEAGYLVISMMTEGNPVVEISFSSWGALYNKSDKNDFFNGDEMIYYLGPDGYYIEIDDNTVYSIYNRFCYDKATINEEYEEFRQQVAMIQSTQTTEFDSNGIVTWETAALRPSSVYKISSFGVGSDYWVMTHFSLGSVCAPTAATNIIWYWGFQRNCNFIKNRVNSRPTYLEKATRIFNWLYESMGTSYTGGTLDTNVLNGYADFFLCDAMPGGRWNYRYIPNGSTYDTYKAAFNGQCPVHLQARMNSNPFSPAGHDMYAFGYASGTDGTQYIFVMDGWNIGGRCVKYNYYPVLKGYKIWVNTSA